jgi:hypothetical protein
VIFARPIDRKLTLWIGFLALLAAFNVGLWIWTAHVAAPRTGYVQGQLLLSGVYVWVCGFRSLFPRVDLERVCLWDTWLSDILLGRTAATIAELCFALQCALFVQHLSAVTGLWWLRAESSLFVPLVLVAELVCWYAVLSLNHIGHVIEESLWALLMLLLCLAFGAAALTRHGPLRPAFMVGFLAYAVGAGLTIAVDVRMYVRRWRQRVANGYLPIAEGLRDSRRRRHPTSAWADWRAEAPWMTLYFSIGAWTSLAMVFL